MERLSRLFGKKPKKGDASISADSSAELKAEIPQIEEYGLHFQFESGENRIYKDLPITIGRLSENSIIIDDDSVSARHAEVYFDPAAKDICILDLDSLNGVFINERPTRMNILTDGARIKVGAVTLVYRNRGYLHPD